MEPSLGYPMVGPLTGPSLAIALLVLALVTWWRRRESARSIRPGVWPQAWSTPVRVPPARPERAQPAQKVLILYGTTTGRARSLAHQLADRLAHLAEVAAQVQDVADLDFDEHLRPEAAEGTLVILLMATYTEGTPPESARWFYQALAEAAQDFRTQHSILQGLRFAVFGLGHSLYGQHFNTVARNCDRYLHQLSAARFHPLGLGDENVAVSVRGSLEADFEHWQARLVARLSRPEVGGGLESGPADRTEDAWDSEASSEASSEADSEAADPSEAGDGLVDLEDIGQVMHRAQVQRAAQAEQGPKPMITPSLRQSLTKQGYKLIGSHSGVKICRWTKAMMRGRGGCYKHSFYGIASHRCMETTPSLACANKCVFCWRHHSNPVGTEWRWQMNQPEEILEGALTSHYQMIKQMKGVPGVLPERLAEGMRVQHCALSLVGEPIMYPEINR
eukprot:snap_masked-scaffold209_size256900-processed-gene-0.8 protein:Tk05660 transcript:snap_masked-scaffold209_size256900-processed-gene-0.8-mRNA-1 annotation:"trna wybutosine-synthesizing protein 1 homolog"